MTIRSVFIRCFKCVLPDTLVGQTSMAILLALLSAQSLSFWILSGAYENTLHATHVRFIADQIVNRVRQFEAAPVQMPHKNLHSDKGVGLSFTLYQDAAFQAGLKRQGRSLELKTDATSRQMVKRLERRLGEKYIGKVVVFAKHASESLRSSFKAAHHPGYEMEERKKIARRKGLQPGSVVQLEVAIEVGNQLWLYTIARPPAIPPLLARQTIIALSLSIVFVLLVVIFMVRRIIKPLQQLAVASEKLGKGIWVEPLKIEGALDIRQTLETFNQMNERLQRFVRERTTILAALSHDLRTPVTSLQLRVSMLPEGEEKDKLADTVEDMRQMIETSLFFAKNASHQERTQILDIVSLAESVCADLMGQGYAIEFHETERITLQGRPVSLKRALANIIRNGALYGERAEVSLLSDSDNIQIMVKDHGKGIEVSAQEQVFEPFFRLEGSRNRDTGGVGLGLAISRDIIRSHGGDIFFTQVDNLFCVQVNLPVTVRLKEC